MEKTKSKYFRNHRMRKTCACGRRFMVWSNLYDQIEHCPECTERMRKERENRLQTDVEIAERRINAIEQENARIARLIERNEDRIAKLARGSEDRFAVMKDIETLKDRAVEGGHALYDEKIKRDHLRSQIYRLRNHRNIARHKISQRRRVGDIDPTDKVDHQCLFCGAHYHYASNHHDPNYCRECVRSGFADQHRYTGISNGWDRKPHVKVEIKDWWRGRVCVGAKSRQSIADGAVPVSQKPQSKAYLRAKFARIRDGAV